MEGPAPVTRRSRWSVGRSRGPQGCGSASTSAAPRPRWPCSTATAASCFAGAADSPRDDYPATIGLIAGLVGEAEASVGAQCTVGVGIPGAVSPATGLVKNANSAWLNGRALPQDLQAALGRPVRIQNDANCLAMSEATDGAAAGAYCVLALILGTGVGAGICIGGQVLAGRNAIAGEWGHNPLPPAMPGANPRRCRRPAGAAAAAASKPG